MKEQLSAEMRAALEKDAELCAEVPCKGPRDLEAYRRQYNHARRYWNQGGPKMAETLDFSVPFESGQVPCRLHRPAPANGKLLPGIVYLHGGGWVVGSIETHDRIMRELASRTGFPVVGVDYTLSPEVRFPTSHNQCLEVVKHLTQQGSQYGIDSERINVAGDSAGAHMSLYCVLRCRDQGINLASACLIYGAYGLLDSPSRRLNNTGEDDLGEDDMQFYISSLMGENANPAKDGYDLLRKNFCGMAPCLITNCVLDPLRDDSTLLSNLLDRAGTEQVIREFDNVTHGFLHYSDTMKDSRTCLQLCADWVSNKACL